MLRQLLTRGIRSRGPAERVFAGSRAWSRGFADETGGENKDAVDTEAGGAFDEGVAYDDDGDLEEEGDIAEDYKPPASVHGVAGRYAAALYMAGAKAGKLSEIDRDLSEFQETAEESEELRGFLKDPSIPKNAKKAILDEIATKLECNDLTKNFLHLLNDNTRLSEFGKIATTFEELVAAARGEVLATITTAEPIEDEEIEEVQTVLLDLLEDGQSLITQTKVDPSIIGGIVVDIGDKHLDLSYSSRLKRIKQLVLGGAA